MRRGEIIKHGVDVGNLPFPPEFNDRVGIGFSTPLILFESEQNLS